MKRTLAAIVLAALLTGLTIAFPVYAQNNQGRIEGRITNLTIGGPPAEPLPSVEILVNEWMALRSGAEGEWNVTGLPPGVYSVRLNLPPGYSPAQEVITATIWGDNIETIDLAFYEGDVPLPAAVPTAASDDRVQPLGSSPTATLVVTGAKVITAALSGPGNPTVIPVAAVTGTTALPGQAGEGYSISYPTTAALVIIAVLGLVIAGWGAFQEMK